MKILLKYTKITLSLMLVLFLMVQCEEDVELPKVVAGFTQTINEDTGTVAFINTSAKATKYLWNFGDGKQEKGKKIEHYYKHPGNYNVVLNASFDNNHAVARAIVLVVKPNITSTTTLDGLEFENLSSNEINIGGWKVKSEDKMKNNIDITFHKDFINLSD